MCYVEQWKLNNCGQIMRSFVIKVFWYVQKGHQHHNQINCEDHLSLLEEVIVNYECHNHCHDY